LTHKLFTKLLGLFLLLLLVYAVAMELLFGSLLSTGLVAASKARLTAAESFQLLGGAALWAGLIALAVALPLAAWAARRLRTRLESVTAFARRIANGELSARLTAVRGPEELSAMEAALNQAAARLGKSFAEMESRCRELAAMLDAMQEAVVAITSEGLVCWSNAQMRRIAGTQIRLGRPLVHSVRDPELLACVKAALDERELRYGRASSLVHGRVFEINAAPLPAGGALAVLHDVTRIEAAENSSREFIANVSHELRTPLTSIQGYVETLVEAPRLNPKTTREFLSIIHKNAARMNRLTEDLLALASLESPDHKLALQPTRASALLEDAIESLGGIVADAGVELQFFGAPDALVLADPDAMNQVFGNLIENALKYGKAGQRILVGARLLEAEPASESAPNPAAEVEFSVQDFGPGIASEHLVRIFERFYRIDKARSRESGGTGLGLAIVKHIVLAHGGRIWAESELGSGTAFRFALPLAPGTGQTSTPGLQQTSSPGLQQVAKTAGKELEAIGKRRETTGKRPETTGL
jgi:two-component system phosphate regulon sensor histidine kinase PhoR